MVLAATTDRFANHLRRSLPDPIRDALVFEADLDRGLERCENTVLAAAALEPGKDGPERGRLLESVADDLLRHLDSQIAFEEMVSQLQPWLEPRDYQTGDRLAVQGEVQAGVQLIVMGHASVYREGVRRSQCVAGDAVEPLAAFGAHPAGASTIADGPCRTVLFTRNARLLLEEFHPRLGLAFYRFLVGCEHASRHRSPDERDSHETLENAGLAAESRQRRIGVDTVGASAAPVTADVPVAPRSASGGGLYIEKLRNARPRESRVER